MRPSSEASGTRRSARDDTRNDARQAVRVLVTGAGGPAGVAVIRSLQTRSDVDVFVVDMDPWASGLYLVDAAHRSLVPAGGAEGFTDALTELCARWSIDVLFSTVDAELIPVLECRQRIEDLGTRIAAPSLDTVRVCLDKFALAQACDSHVPVPRTALLDADGMAEHWVFPVIVKPRAGSGSRGVSIVQDRVQLERRPHDRDYIIQAFLPGAEYSVDVLADQNGHVVAAVPRVRERVDSGVSIAGRTVHDDELIETASRVARAVGLTGVANIQLRIDVNGAAALLEVNPRFPGAMPLTIASGVDMPSLMLDSTLGHPIPATVDFAEVAMVRHLHEIIITPQEVAEMQLPEARALHATRFGEPSALRLQQSPEVQQSREAQESPDAQQLPDEQWPPEAQQLP